MKHSTLVIIALLIYFQLYSLDDLEFVRLNSNNGLSSEEIRNVFQDSEGYLWFLTREGLNRYDGYDIKIFKPEDEGLGFNSASFESICEDAQNRLWLGTLGKGVVIFDKLKQTVVTFEEFSNGLKIPNKQIRSLTSDKHNNIWIGTEYGLYKFDIESNHLTFFNLGNSGSSEPAWCIIESILEDYNGNIWIGTWNMGLFIFNSTSNEIESYNTFNYGQTSYNDNRIKSLFEDNNENMWVGTWEDGLYQVELTSDGLRIQQNFLYDDNNDQTISGDIIYSINQDNNNNLWIGTPYGLTIIEHIYSKNPYFNNFSYIYGNKKGISNNEVWKIIKDRSGLMWLGTLEGGVNKINPEGKVFVGYTIPPINPQINSQTVMSFCTDPSGSLLVGVKSLGFGKYDLKNKNYTHYSQIAEYDSLPANINTVMCLMNEDDAYLWLGTRYSGLIVYDYTSKRYTALNALHEAFTYETVNVIYHQKKSVILVGTEGGLFKIERCASSNDCYDIKRVEGLSGNRINSVCQDNYGNLWVGTAENGINRLDTKQENISIVTFNEAEQNISTNRILKVFEDSRNNLWVGTADQGLLKFEESTASFRKAEITKGSKPDMIFGITEDLNGNLWLTTNKGLTRLIVQNKNLITDRYTIIDGLQGNIFVKGSIFRQNNNRIFVGGYYGFNSFFPEDVKPNLFIPPTVLTDLLVNGQQINVDEEANMPLVLKHNKNNLTFQFSALSYYKPEKNTFSYKLEGYNDDWQFVDASIRMAQFPNLDAGSYTFYLKSANSSELWNQEPVVLELKVLPAPYKTWWAYTGYSVAVLLILVMIYRFLLNNEKVKRALEIEKIEHAKSEKLNQFKLRFFTNISHELLTPLSVISCSIDIVKQRSRTNKEELKVVDRNISQLNRLLHQLLDFRKTESGHLKLKIGSGNFNNYVSHLVSNFESLANNKRISLNMDLPASESNSFFDVDILDKILDNLLTNALKYTDEGGAILVSSKILKQQTTRIAEFTVSDTGIGIPNEEMENIFNRFYRLEAGNEDTGTGIGLAFTKSLVELHKGKISVESETGKGSTFKVSIPVDRDSFSEDELTSGHLESYAELKENKTKPLNPITPSQLNRIKRANIKLMIVDDNNDFRSILKFHFNKMYEVMEAADGELALKKAIEQSPDIIISDVLMPKKDGIELCIDLKNNVDTKNIPVILLTAKKGEEELLKGYKAGADSYIAKPVSLQVLESRINALLMKRQDNSPVKLAIDKNYTISKRPPDHLFVNSVEQYIIENISDSGLTVKTIAQHFAMSDSMLFRRLKKLTALPPVEFVKRVRLNQAAIILKNGDISIADVAYKMGFSDQSYFTACFKKQFKTTPTDYMRVKTANKKTKVT